jgi:hypothetical protein
MIWRYINWLYSKYNASMIRKRLYLRCPDCNDNIELGKLQVRGLVIRDTAPYGTKYVRSYAFSGQSPAG